MRDVTELGREYDLVPASLDGAADQFLVDVGAVRLGGVDVGDAEVQCPLDGTDRLVVTLAAPV